MTDTEINTFIDFMSDVGDLWNFNDAERVYGKYTLKNAINDRQNAVLTHLNNFSAIINQK